MKLPDSIDILQAGKVQRKTLVHQLDGDRSVDGKPETEYVTIKTI
jgi:hypothetical protein